MGLSFYFSNLQGISALCTKGRTIYSNSKLRSMYDLKDRKVWFGLVWFSFTSVVFWFVFSPYSGIFINKVSVTAI